MYECLPVEAQGAPLPGGSVAMVQGIYMYRGKAYDCRQPGLYRFWSGRGAPIESRIVYGGDLYAFMSAVSWHHIQSVDDESKLNDLQALADAGRWHKWRLRCGGIVQLLNWWLPQYGLRTRLVECHTLEPSNGVDDGHALIEVRHRGKWKAWDVTNGCYFTDQDGEHLSLGEVIEAGVLKCMRVPIDGDEKAGASTALAGRWCMASYFDLCRRTPAQRDEWFRRVFQAWSVMT